jgi:hypothetical protein
LEKELISSERWKNYSITYANDFVKALESILAEAKEKSPYIKVVLELDDAEKIIEAGAELKNILRATLQINQAIVAILAGTSRLLTPIEDQYTSPFQELFISLILKPLSQKETEELIMVPSETIETVGVSYDANTMDRIYELCGGSPRYYKVICNHLIFTANEKGRNRISVEDVNNIVSDVLEDKAILYEHTWNQLNDQEKNILRAMISNRSMKGVSKKSFNHLEIMQLIFEDKGKYRFTAQLFEEWCKRYKMGGD